MGKLIITGYGSATSASTMAVTFNTAPADTSKVAFTVKGSSGTVAATTTTWNSANTVATLTSASNFVEDTYSVDVQNNSTDLGTSSVTIAQQKVAKIQITSTVLSVVPGVESSTTPNAGKGFATYKVFDQYGNDITSTPLGNNINWTVGVGTVDSTLTRNGVLAVDPLSNIPLTTYASSGATINAYDTDDYVTASANLTVSMSTGTLSGITLTSLTSPNNDDFNAGNTSGQWYINYTALDASGNPTSNYSLVSSGVLQINGGAFLTCGIVEDPTDSTKAAISVQINSTYASTLAADTQIPITILTTSGQSSTLEVTLKKAASLYSFTMNAPTQMVASGETVDIPFTAVDQNGNAITSFGSLNGLVNLTMTGSTDPTQFELIENGDGSATLQAELPANQTTTSMTCYLMANVIATGKTSQLTLNIQKQALANSLTLDSSVLIPIMQQNSIQNIDFGYNYGGLSVEDQYGRAFDMTSTQNGASNSAEPNYQVVAVPYSSGSQVVTVGGNDGTKAVDATPGADGTVAYAEGSHGISITANPAAGSESVTFELIDTNQNTDYTYTGATKPTITYGTSTNPYTVIDSKTETFSVVNSTDIKGYTLSTLAQQFAQAGTGADPLVSSTLTTMAGTKAVDGDYDQAAKVYGTLSNGNKVLLAPTFDANDNTTSTSVSHTFVNTVVNASVDSGDFAVAPDSAPTTGGVATTTQTDVYANSYNLATNPSETTSSGNVTVIVNGTDGTIHTLTTKATSSSAGVVCKSVSFYADTTETGISVSNSIITVSAADLSASKAMVYANSDGSETAAGLYFDGVDQYGTKCAPLSVYIASQTGPTAAVMGINGKWTTAPVAGDKVVLTAVAANGLSKTITLNVD